MAKDRQTIRSELRDDLGIDPNGRVWSDTTLNQLIHEGEIEVARRNIAITELETSATFTTTVGSREYPFSTIASDLLRVISVIYDVASKVNYTASTIAFADSNPDTITDSASGFGSFVAGMKLQVIGSSSNDGVDHLTIATVAAGTLTLSSSDVVTAESAGSSISLIGRTIPDHEKQLLLVEDIRQIEGTNFSNIAGYPSKYAIDGASLVFDVLPKEADLVQIRYVKIPAEMSTEGTNSDLPDELIPVVRLWAQYLAWHQKPGNENESQIAKARFEAELRRKITMRNLNDFQGRSYGSYNWRRANNIL